MSASIIPADSLFAVFIAIFSIIGFAYWSESTAIGRRISAPIIMLLCGLLLSNTGVMPKVSPVYNIVWTYFIPVAVPLLLFGADFRSIVKGSGPTLGAFGLCVAGTIAGAVIGFFLLPVGESAAELAGIFAATYIGGSMNFAAVSETLSFKDHTLLTASLAADNIAGILHILIMASLPSVLILRQFFVPSQVLAQQTQQAGEKHNVAQHFDVMHICAALSISLLMCYLGNLLSNSLSVPDYNILFSTLLTLILANIFRSRLSSLQGHFQLGTFFMSTFFVTVGASADIGLLLESGKIIFIYALLIVFIHTFVILIGGKILKLSLVDLVIASLACVGGPAVPAAIAAARGWHNMVLPGIMCGIFGYAIANFIGVALAKILAG